MTSERGTVADLSHIAESLRTLAMDVSLFHEDPANARSHPDRNAEATAASLKRYGQRKPIVVNRKNMIIEAGNCTLRAAKMLKWTTLAAVLVDDDPITATGYAIADNRTGELAEWNEDVLARLLKDLGEEEDLPSLGWTDAELAVLSASLDGPPPEGEDPGAGEPPADPVSKLGEVYLLGSHRLMCGDSTKQEDVAILLDGGTPKLMATDPPYHVGYKGGQHPPSKANKGAANRDKEWKDYNEIGCGETKLGVEFYSNFIRIALLHLHPRALIYQWHASRVHSIIDEAWTRNGLLCHQQIIWVKARAILTRSHFMWKHEPCFYGWVRGNMPDKKTRCSPVNETTVWEIDQKGEQHGIHPTQKPVEIFRRPYRWHLKTGELGYEPFCGSGSCLIAAAMEGRRCYAMELSPAFCDVIRLRWAKYAESAGIDPGPGAL